jgi:hypothetical protein
LLVVVALLLAAPHAHWKAISGAATAEWQGHGSRQPAATHIPNTPASCNACPAHPPDSAPSARSTLTTAISCVPRPPPALALPISAAMPSCRHDCCTCKRGAAVEGAVVCVWAWGRTTGWLPSCRHDCCTCKRGAAVEGAVVCVCERGRGVSARVCMCDRITVMRGRMVRHAEGLGASCLEASCLEAA